MFLLLVFKKEVWNTSMTFMGPVKISTEESMWKKKCCFAWISRNVCSNVCWSSRSVLWCGCEQIETEVSYVGPTVPLSLISPSTLVHKQGGFAIKGHLPWVAAARYFTPWSQDIELRSWWWMMTLLRLIGRWNDEIMKLLYRQRWVVMGEVEGDT